MTLPNAARTVDISPSLLDRVTVREFYAARAGNLGTMTIEEFDYLLTSYIQAVNPSGYGKLITEYRAMLQAQALLWAVRLCVTLPYGTNKDLYAMFGLTSNPKQCKGRLGVMERRAAETMRAYNKAVESDDTEVVSNWSEEMAHEVAVLSRYLGFAVNPQETAIGVYIGYLSLMVAEAEKKQKTK